jgi:hypothetical protein
MDTNSDDTLLQMGEVMALAMEGQHPLGATPVELVTAIRDECISILGLSEDNAAMYARAVESEGYRTFIEWRLQDGGTE